MTPPSIDHRMDLGFAATGDETPINRSDVSLSVLISAKAAPTVGASGVARAQGWATVTPLTVTSWASASSRHRRRKASRRQGRDFETHGAIPPRDV